MANNDRRQINKTVSEGHDTTFIHHFSSVGTEQRQESYFKTGKWYLRLPSIRRQYTSDI